MKEDMSEKKRTRERSARVRKEETYVCVIAQREGRNEREELGPPFWTRFSIMKPSRLPADELWRQTRSCYTQIDRHEYHWSQHLIVPRVRKTSVPHETAMAAAE